MIEAKRKTKKDKRSESEELWIISLDGQDVISSFD